MGVFAAETVEPQIQQEKDKEHIVEEKNLQNQQEEDKDRGELGWHNMLEDTAQMEEVEQTDCMELVEVVVEVAAVADIAVAIAAVVIVADVVNLVAVVDTVGIVMGQMQDFDFLDSVV